LISARLVRFAAEQAFEAVGDRLRGRRRGKAAAEPGRDHGRDRKSVQTLPEHAILTHATFPSIQFISSSFAPPAL